MHRYTDNDLNYINALICFMENLNEPWGIKDLESKHIYMNNHAIRYTNTPPNFDIEGRKDNEFPAAWAEISDELQDHDRLTEKRKQNTAIIETHYWNGEQSLRPYISNKTPLFNKNGRCLGTAWTSREITMLSPIELINKKTPSVLVTDIKQNIFTKKELDVIFWSQQKLSSKEISRFVGVSHRTVENKLQGIYNKIGINSVSQLIEHCKEKGWDKYIPPDLLKKGVVFC
ncbi:helix-turn-helix transcriptional regulator [Candidatus Sodalis sp. SoCistrobi]|uniref:helix-turn-helix transcriptional regulator n=1 Tax=Candidatus Sodalis sp. SoCistrobi TaxID=1922216 RepID=UPI00093E479B|nr:helix-turn-helix transcriptional regulator [Candidatus Sodalis sp. SoCistrobi]